MKGENIFKCKDGRWEARYVKKRAPSGQIIYGFCYGKSYKEVKEKVTRFKSTEPKIANTSSTSSRKKFAVFCDKWLESCRGRLKASTCERYRIAVERHIKPNLGDCLPQSITSEMVAEFSSIMLNEGLSPKNCKRCADRAAFGIKIYIETVALQLAGGRNYIPKRTEKGGSRSVSGGAGTF